MSRMFYAWRKHFVHRILALTGVRRLSLSRVVEGNGFHKKVATKSLVVVLSPEFHHDLDVLRWLVSDGL